MNNMSMLPLTPEELLTTTRSVRKRLDLDRPVLLILYATAWRSHCRRRQGRIGRAGIGQ